MKYLWFILPIMLAGCPVPVHEPEPDPEPPSACALACDRLAQLGCEEAEPDEDGNDCVTVCEVTQEAGVLDLKPEEIAEADRCPE